MYAIYALYSLYVLYVLYSHIKEEQEDMNPQNPKLNKSAYEVKRKKYMKVSYTQHKGITKLRQNKSKLY